MASLLDYQKIECLLDVNIFDKPTELVGKEAWIQQIQHLLFLKKGTYPSNPELGIGIQTYDYAFIDDVISKLRDEITDQVRTYFPDMPFDSVVLVPRDHPTRREKILIMIFNFATDASNIETVVVASSVSNSRIDFEVSF